MEKERVWVERGAIALRGALLMACDWRRIARGWPSTAMGPPLSPPRSSVYGPHEQGVPGKRPRPRRAKRRTAASLSSLNENHSDGGEAGGAQR